MDEKLKGMLLGPPRTVLPICARLGSIGPLAVPATTELPFWRLSCPVSLPPTSDTSVPAEGLMFCATVKLEAVKIAPVGD